MITKIISGGQTGADQGALSAAKQLGIETGGTAPKGYRTDDGPNIDLCILYGLETSPSRNYVLRTEENVTSSDGTLLFGDLTSPGTRLTEQLSYVKNKPFFYVAWNNSQTTTIDHIDIHEFRNWILRNNIKILNVAGNRERINPGIFQAVKDFLIAALSDTL